MEKISYERRVYESVDDESYVRLYLKIWWKKVSGSKVVLKQENT